MDVVKRLRAAANGLRSYYQIGAVELIPADTMTEAADLIEAQASALEVAREALACKRDYVADAAKGFLFYKDSGDGFKAMATEDLERLDNALAKLNGVAPPSTGDKPQT